MELEELIDQLHKIGFENKITVKYSSNWFTTDDIDIHYNTITTYNHNINFDVLVYTRIHISTSIPEFLLLSSKLEIWKTLMVNNGKIFKIILKFSELPNHIKFECAYIGCVGYSRQYRILENNIQTSYYSLSPFRLNKIRPDLNNSEWRHNLISVVNCLKECDVIDIYIEYDATPYYTEDPFQTSLLPDGINFDDVKNAINLEKFEKEYGSTINLPEDVRKKIYSLATPVIREFPNQNMNMEAYPYNWNKNKYENI